MSETDTPQIGLGSALVITPTGPTFPLTVVKCSNIKMPTITAKDVETTGMSDSGDTYQPGVLNYGEGEFDVIYLKTQSATLQTLVNVPANFVTTYPDGRVKTYPGWINSFGEEVPLKEKIMNKIKVRASGPVVNS